MDHIKLLKCWRQIQPMILVSSTRASILSWVHTALLRRYQSSSAVFECISLTKLDSRKILSTLPSKQLVN